LIANNIIINGILSTLLLFTLINVVLKIRYKDEKSLNYFLYFCMSYLIGIFLTSLRNTIPDFFSIVVAVTVLVLGYIFLYIAIRGLLGLDFKWLHRYFLPIIIVFFGLYIFTEVYYDLHLRIIIFSLFIISHSITLSYFFWQASLKRLKIINIISAIAFILISIVFFLRALYAVTMNHTIEFAYSTKFMVLSPYVALFVTLVIMMINIVLHLKKKYNF